MSKYKNQQAIDEFRKRYDFKSVFTGDELKGLELLGKDIEQFLDEQLTKKGFEVLSEFMQFMRNGHNLNEKDLDRIESEYALYTARHYPEQAIKKLLQPCSKYKNQQAIERLRDEFGTREFINAPREDIEQFLDEQLEKRGEEVRKELEKAYFEDIVCDADDTECRIEKAWRKGYNDALKDVDSVFLKIQTKK